MPDATPDEAARFERATEIFDAVCDVPARERQAEVDRLCVGDVELRRLVMGMLEHETAEASLFEAVDDRRGVEAVAGDVLSSFGDDPSNVHIEGYEIIREIGRGGMGVIYEARQVSPSRRVALKLLKPGMAHGDVMRRFHRESHVLAQLQHPGIAQIFEVGVADVAGVGRPYFSMELVEGVSLEKHADAAGLDTRQRLELLARVCDAVGYANGKGVVHRDLKPGNVLVVGPAASDSTTGHGDAIGAPKVLDFGIARVTDPTFEATTIETVAGQIVGTLAYMSPEQLAGDADELDARCDVYALGAIGYELLAGQRAHQVHGLAVPEAARVVRDDDPLPLTSLDRSLAGDVTTIIAKAMEKDPDRRYASASDLAADLRRHLTDVPIVARPASTFYQLRKFAKRNRGLVGGVAAAIFVLVLGVIGTGAALLEALRANDELTRTNEELARVSEFQSARVADNAPSEMAARLRAELMATVSDEDRGAVEAALRATNFTDLAVNSLEENVFAASERAIDERFRDDPLIRATLLQSLAARRLALGLYDPAITSVERALETRREVLGDDHPDVIESLGTRSQLSYEVGDYDRAVADARAVVEWNRRVLGDTDAATVASMNLLASFLQQTDGLEESYNLSLESRALGEASLGDDHPETIEAINLAGSLLLIVGRSDEAIPLFTEADERLVSSMGPEHSETISNALDLGLALAASGRSDEAVERLSACIDVLDRNYGSMHPRTIGATNNLSTVLMEASRFQEAIPVSRTAYERSGEVLGNRHPSTLTAAGNLATALSYVGDAEGAEVLYRSTLEARRAVHGDAHRATLITLGNLAGVVKDQGNVEEAVALLEECADGFRALEGLESAATLNAIQIYAIALTEVDRTDDAIPLYRQALEGRRRFLGDAHPDTLNSIYNMGEVLLREGDVDAAEPYCEDAFRLYRDVAGEKHIGTMYSAANLARVRREQERFEDAEELMRRAHDGFNEVLGPGHVASRTAAEELADILNLMGRASDASANREQQSTRDDD